MFHIGKIRVQIAVDDSVFIERLRGLFHGVHALGNIIVDLRKRAIKLLADLFGKDIAVKNVTEAFGDQRYDGHEQQEKTDGFPAEGNTEIPKR